MTMNEKPCILNMVLLEIQQRGGDFVNKKMYIAWLMLFCAVCLLLGACSSVGVSSGGRVEETIPDGSAGHGASAEPSAEDSSGEPLDVPAVVTRSYVLEQTKVNEQVDLLETALYVYGEQDTTFRVKISAKWDSASAHYRFHDLICYNNVCSLCREYAVSNEDKAYISRNQRVQEPLYYDPDADWLASASYIPPLYADLKAGSLARISLWEDVIVELIDELPEQLCAYNTITEDAFLPEPKDAYAGF